ncbi:MAG: hypothetical protein IPJ65_06050 [Archangiaceae bacterium]|nr:hypothetical protein [Archangiaceae bacterium]
MSAPGWCSATPGNERVEPQAVGAFVNHLGQLTRGATLPTSPAAYAPPPPVAPAQQPWQAFSNPAMYQLGNRALNGFDAPLANQMMTCAGPQLPAMASALYPQTWNAYPMNAYSYPGAWYQTPFTAPMTNPAWQMAGAAAAWTIGSAMWSCYPANMFGYNLMWSGWPYAMAMW